MALPYVAPAPDPSSVTPYQLDLSSPLYAIPTPDVAQPFTTPSGNLIYSSTPMPGLTAGVPTPNWVPALLIGGVAVFMLAFASALRN